MKTQDEIIEATRAFKDSDIVADFKYCMDEYGKELLLGYSMWLTKNGYMDTDWKDEEPYAIDEFLKEQRKK